MDDAGNDMGSPRKKIIGERWGYDSTGCPTTEHSMEFANCILEAVEYSLGSGWIEADSW